MLFYSYNKIYISDTPFNSEDPVVNFWVPITLIPSKNPIVFLPGLLSPQPEQLYIVCYPKCLLGEIMQNGLQPLK